MKKFFRRLKTSPSPPSSQTSSYTTIPLTESPLLHQLTPIRATPFPPALLPSSSLLIADEVPELMCATCAGSQFPELLAWKPGERRPWISLAHVLADEGEPGCPYCAFFRALIGGEAGMGRDGKFVPYLRIRRGFERLGVGEKHELGGTVLVEVMGRNKRLPWGYIVKAAEEEVEGEGYLSEETVIRGRMISPLLSVDLVRLWLDYCVGHHHDPKRGCLRRRGLPAGVRLIDVTTRTVVKVDELEGIAPDYLTLSYVWGEQHGRWNEPLTTDDKLPEDIPPLISDALEFTQKLGYDYLWIDHYCQPPSEQQHPHLEHLGEIFAQSALTLIIASSTSITDGIPGISTPRTPQLSIKTETGLYTTTLLRPDLAVASLAWSKRGWTYQEGLLARRRLVFTDSQVYFQCQSMHCHESLAVPLMYDARGLNLGRVFPEVGPGEDVKSLVKNYIAKTGFSKPEERLDAFRGVLTHFKTEVSKPMDSFLGLPLFNEGNWLLDQGKTVTRTDRLAVALSWIPSIPRLSETPTNPYKLEDSIFPFPSWTWLSWSLREGHTPHFGLSLIPDDSTIQGITAPPGMELTLGFSDYSLLSWEADLEAIQQRREEDIRFLRMKSYVFPVAIRKEGDAVVIGGKTVLLGRPARECIKSWFKASAVEKQDGEYEVLGIVISGKGWKGGSGGARGVSVLVCNTDGWPGKEEEGQEKEENERDRLKRLGVLTLSYTDFTPVDSVSAVLEGVELDKGDRGDLNVELREVDVY